MAAKKKPPVEPNPLLEQLRFISSILAKKGEPNETCCVIANGAITAFNKPLSAGILTEAAISANPPCHQLIAALERCKDGYAMSELRGVVSVNSGPLRVTLPTVAGLPASTPDGYYSELAPALFEAIAQVAHIADEDAEHIQSASICVSEGLVSTTNRNVIMQAYHGLNLPTLMLPKKFVTRVLSVGKAIKGFGCSDNSFTVFFEDNSWLRTSTMDAEPLPYSSVCAWNGEWFPMSDIWEGLDNVMPFRGNSDAIRLSDMRMETPTASYAVEWSVSHPEIRINADYLKAVKPYVEHFAIDNGKFYFYKGNVRGVVALMA
jgi:hypothetical protein